MLKIPHFKFYTLLSQLKKKKSRNLIFSPTSEWKYWPTEPLFLHVVILIRSRRSYHSHQITNRHVEASPVWLLFAAVSTVPTCAPSTSPAADPHTKKTPKLLTIYEKHPNILYILKPNPFTSFSSQTLFLPLSRPPNTKNQRSKSADGSSASSFQLREISLCESD